MIGEERQSLFLIHRDAIWRFALRISPNEEDAEDILQDVAVAILAHHTGPPDAEFFLGWCCVVARNLAAHKHRSEARRRRETVAMHLGGPSYTMQRDDPEGSTIARNRLRTRLERVNSIAISLLRDRFVLEETSEEIAAHLHVSSACIRMRLARILAILRVDRGLVSAEPRTHDTDPAKRRHAWQLKLGHDDGSQQADCGLQYPTVASCADVGPWASEH